MSASSSIGNGNDEHSSPSKKLKDEEVDISSLEEEVKRCVDAFKQGKPIMVFDSAFRECETDLLWPAVAATPLVCYCFY